MDYRGETIAVLDPTYESSNSKSPEIVGTERISDIESLIVGFKRGTDKA